MQHSFLLMILAIFSGNAAATGTGAPSCPSCMDATVVNNSVATQASTHNAGESKSTGISLSDLTVSKVNGLSIEALGSSAVGNVSTGGGDGTAVAMTQIGGIAAGSVNQYAAVVGANVVGTISAGKNLVSDFTGGAKATVVANGAGDLKTSVSQVTVNGIGDGLANSAAALSSVACPKLPAIGLPTLDY